MTMSQPERPKRGRPPVPKNQARRNRVVTFLTDAELNQLKQRALKMEMTLSQACHRLIRKALF
jgi:hypothetical protein